MKTIQGVAVSDGIAIGPCVVLDMRNLDVEPRTADNPDDEWLQVERAKVAVEGNLNRQLEALAGSPHADILIAHKTMLSDPQLISAIESSIRKDNETADYAVSHNILTFANMLESLPDEYLRERAQDLQDLRIQWLNAILGIDDVTKVDSGSIICADELLPSQFLQVRSNGVGGIVTAQGGTTSHVSILARNFGIPMVTGVPLDSFQSGEQIAVDGHQGEIFIHPDEVSIERLRQAQQEFRKMLEQAHASRYLAAKTSSGQVIEVAANIGGPDDIESVLEAGADGVGLFRTEFLFMDRSTAPSEDEQFDAYKQVVEALDGKRVVIRTLDAGADKLVSYLHFDHEENPFLGVRGLRYTLLHKDLFLTQLKAVLRAAHFGKISLMFPMVTNEQDIHEALLAVDEAKQALQGEGKTYGDVELGAMIEVPAAAMITDLLAKQLDFVSVGTNDLIQYTTAADRMNPQVTPWYDASHPGLWRLLEQVARGAHSQGAWVGMCGELAGTLEYIPKLIELGFDELSMSPKRVGLVKTSIRNL